MNEVTITNNQTPIEIALGVDENGMTTAKKLYEFLELNPSNYSKWIKSNITDNEFAEENIDYEVFVPNDENPLGGRPTMDYKLSSSFAKKLAMKNNSEKVCLCQVKDFFKEYKPGVGQVSIESLISDKKIIKRICRVL